MKVTHLNEIKINLGVGGWGWGWGWGEGGGGEVGVRALCVSREGMRLAGWRWGSGGTMHPVFEFLKVGKYVGVGMWHNVASTHSWWNNMIFGRVVITINKFAIKLNIYWIYPLAMSIWFVYILTKTWSRQPSSLTTLNMVKNSMTFTHF